MNFSRRCSAALVWSAIALPFMTLSAGTVLGHEGATGIVASRMGVMKEMAESMKVIGEMLNDRREFDAATAREAARSLRENGHLAHDQFPSGTNDHHTRAAPAVWEKREAFEEQLAQFDTVIEFLIAATETENPESMKAPFMKVGHACSSCHERFRLSER